MSFRRVIGISATICFLLTLVSIAPDEGLSSTPKPNMQCDEISGSTKVEGNMKYQEYRCYNNIGVQINDKHDKPITLEKDESQVKIDYEIVINAKDISTDSIEVSLNAFGPNPGFLQKIGHSQGTRDVRATVTGPNGVTHDANPLNGYKLNNSIELSFSNTNQKQTLDGSITFERNGQPRDWSILTAKVVLDYNRMIRTWRPKTETKPAEVETNEGVTFQVEEPEPTPCRPGELETHLSTSPSQDGPASLKLIQQAPAHGDTESRIRVKSINNRSYADGSAPLIQDASYLASENLDLFSYRPGENGNRRYVKQFDGIQAPSTSRTRPNDNFDLLVSYEIGFCEKPEYNWSPVDKVNLPLRQPITR